MKFHITKLALPALLSAALLLSGCQSQGTAPSEATSAAGSATVSATSMVSAPAAMDTDALFSSRDLAGDYDPTSAVTITLQGDTATCDNPAVTIDGGRITIAEEGVYLLSGVLTNGQVIVRAGSEDKVQLVLCGADITSADSAAIYVPQADKVFLTLAPDTENHLSNGGSFATLDDSNIDGVVFSKADLTLNGSGSLTVTSPGGHGIVSKDELTITGGSYTVTAAGHGLAGKDSVAISAGSFSITSGKDGIHAEHAGDSAKGLLYIAQGSFTVDAQGDALSASGSLQIDGGSYALTTGGGSAAVTMKQGDTMQRGGTKPAFDPQNRPIPGQPVAPDTTAALDTAEETTSVSCKDIKSDGSLTVQGGTFTLDTADDAVHAAGTVTLSGGAWTIRTGDDGIHSDGDVVIRGGTFSIPYCYEGVEGQTVTIEDGTLDIVANDDGINASSGSSSAGQGGRAPMSADQACLITVNGGFITIVSDGDCLDSNGSMVFNGGTLNLTCNGSGNTAIDTDGSFTNNGAQVTTNDGSESGTGGTGRGPGGGGKVPGGKGGQRPLEGTDRGAPPSDATASPTI